MLYLSEIVEKPASPVVDKLLRRARPTLEERSALFRRHCLEHFRSCSRLLLVEYQQVKDAPISKDQAKTQLNGCLAEGETTYTKHFREELAHDGLTTVDILTVCRSGAFIMEPEKDIKTGELNTGSKGSQPIGVKYRWSSASGTS